MRACFRGSLANAVWNTRLDGLGHSAQPYYLSHKAFGAIYEVRR